MRRLIVVRVFFAVAVIAFGAYATAAQWVPLRAKVRATIEISKNGTTAKTTRTVTFYRLGDGSTLLW